ncbi:hypothetical protein F5I97DRAFT_108788 [Phlebopus sp. FC_14]|nr:hypothetical protein F5I97DRAFT_108788 [Phlebopus sp. FC_14]
MATGPPGSMSAPDSSPPSSDPSWEGDRMFNIYIYDYCNKRGFRKTARELLAEADIPPDSAPPINARQGLLFEWWSVFWVLFNAKSNNTGTDEAIVYTQHQLQQANMRQVANPMRPQPPPMNRMINGTQRPQGLMPTNGQVPNGAGPISLPGNPGPMQNGAQAPMPFPIPGAGHQANGIPMPSGGPPPAGANPGQPQNFNQMLPGQRPGPGPQHRGANGVNPYQSPTMSHSPQNPGGSAGPNPQHPQAPMGQLGPSPHMAHMARGGMLPPNSSMGSVPSAQTPPFTLGRSPSRPGTPGQGGMMQPSPSMMNRPPPMQEANLHAEVHRLPVPLLNTIKQELGLGDKELHSLSYEDKNRIVTLARQRNANPAARKPGPPGPQGPAGPSNPSQGMPHPAQRPPGQHPQQQQMPQQPQQQRVIKRNSTSPGEEHGTLPNNESSPPDRKRARRNSVGMDQPQPVPQYGHQPQQQGAPQMQNGPMLRPGPGPMGGAPMNAFQPHGPPGMAGNPNMGLPMGAPQMANGMNPGMGGPQNMIMGQMQYRANMHAVTKSLAQAHIPGGGGGTPTPGDPSFNPGQGQPPSFPGPQNNRVGQNKPMSMMPPPSPAGGPSKEQPKDVNKPPGGPTNPGHPEGSPRNQQAPNPAQGQANPSSSTQGSTAPPTPSATSSSITAPSPSAVVNGTPTINPATQPATSLPEVPPSFLTTDFMQSVASSLDDFEQSLFRPEDASINFEQDFREWFNPDDLDMK